MNLHEYQAKTLFSSCGLPIPVGRVASSVDEADAVLTALGGDRWVIKAQVHAGGRGKAGGVRMVAGRDDALAFIEELLGSRLVTVQTDEHGQPINCVLIEKPVAIARELYLGAVLDRAQRRVVIMASEEGGVEIEQVAATAPQKILRAVVDPLVGLQAYQCRQLAFGLHLGPMQFKAFSQLVTGISRLYVEKDLSLIEINPLIVTEEGQLLCVDAKINIDDNAMFRHPDLVELRDPTQEDPREVRAKEWDLNYIALDGDIGCMVNGAGLAMATMDLIKLVGGRPANFLDVGGTATKERVAEAFKIILADSNVKGILVNIFGGIVRCDIIAEGIIGAVAEVGIELPVVVRLEGTNAELGRGLLERSGLQIIAASGLAEAAERIVEVTGAQR